MADYLTQADAQNYGHDLLDMAQRAAKHALGDDLARLAHANATLRRQVDNQMISTFEAMLDRALPNWRTVNQDPRWLTWLSGRHELTGQSRQRLLDDAVAQGDANRAVSIFAGFLNSYGATPAPPPPTPQPSYQ